MTSKLLDVSKLPSTQVFLCRDGSSIDFQSFVESHRPGLRLLGFHDVIKPNESFGFAMAMPHMVGEDEPDYRSDDPTKYVSFVGGWGPGRDRYIANAVRKMRALTRRTDENSTLDLHLRTPDHFRDVVESRNDDGTFPWGDFPWGGAVRTEQGGLELFGACSGYSQMQDDVVTRLILGGISERILRGNNLLPD